MRLTTKGRFAVPAMLDLALNATEGPVTLAGISARQKISLSYLQQLFGERRSREPGDSVRGRGGGYPRARGAARVSVADIVRAVEEPIDSTQCCGRENCRDNQRCMTHALWEELNSTVYGFLDGVKLSHLVDKQRTKPVSLVRSAKPREEPQPVSA